jgi:hypothetical protein
LLLACALVTVHAADAPAPGNFSQGTIDELQQHMSAHDLTELRTTYNGSYGASLLFFPQQLTYYVTLFHDKDFWRVIRADQAEEAEKIYATFVEQSRKLAQVDIDAIRLEAGKQFTQHQLDVNRQRLEALRQDLARQQQQAQQVAQQQQQARQQAASLSGELSASSSELEAMQRKIQALETLQSDPTLALPSSGSGSGTAQLASAASPAQAPAADAAPARPAIAAKPVATAPSPAHAKH